MPDEKFGTDEQLFAGLISSFASSAWVALGKIKNPVTDKIERNLEQASYSIDMLDMIQRRMEDNLNETEKKFLQSTLGDLKLNYIEEQKKPEMESETESSDEAEDEPEESEETKVDKTDEEESTEK